MNEMLLCKLSKTHTRSEFQFHICVVYETSLHLCPKGLGHITQLFPDSFVGILTEFYIYEFV